MGSAEQPTKTEDVDLLEGAGEGLLEALVGVGAGARQLAGQVIGQAVVTKTNEPEQDPGPATRTRVTTTRATKSLKVILAERRRHQEEEEALEELEEPEGRGVAQQALDRYEREMEAAQLSRKRTQAEKAAELEEKKLKRSERHRRRGELADEEYQKEEEKRRKDKEAREESERVRRQQDVLLRKAQTLVQHEKNRPGKSAVIAVGEEEGGDKDMWLPDVVISRKDKEKVTKFRQKKPVATKPQEEEEGDDHDEEEEEMDDDGDGTGIDMNDPDIIKLAGCMHAKNIKTAQAYEHYMRGIANSILDKVGESADVPKYYRNVVKSMWSVAQNMRMYKFIKDADLQAVYKAIPDMKCVVLRNRMEGKKTGAAKEIQIETEKVVEVQISREDRRRMPVNRMMANLNDLPADRQADIRLKLTRMYGHQEAAHRDVASACAVFKTLVEDKEIDLNMLRTFAEGTFRPLVAIKIPDVDRLWEAEEAERTRQVKAKMDKLRPINEIIEEQNLPQRPGKDTPKPTNDEGKGTRALQAMVHYFVYGALFEDNPKGITQVAKEFDVPVKSLFGLIMGRRYEGGRQAKERQEKEEQRLLEISKMQEREMSVKVKPVHRAEQIAGQKKKTAQKKTQSGGKKVDPKPGTSKEG